MEERQVLAKGKKLFQYNIKARALWNTASLGQESPLLEPWMKAFDHKEE